MKKEMTDIRSLITILELKEDKESLIKTMVKNLRKEDNKRRHLTLSLIKMMTSTGLSM
jgi:hypothetical protein